MNNIGANNNAYFRRKLPAIWKKQPKSTIVQRHFGQKFNLYRQNDPPGRIPDGPGYTLYALRVSLVPLLSLARSAGKIYTFNKTGQDRLLRRYFNVFITIHQNLLTFTLKIETGQP